MDYSDIIDLPHPEPKYHPRMPMAKRALHFMPFAALPKFYEELDEARKSTENIESWSDDTE